VARPLPCKEAMTAPETPLPPVPLGPGITPERPSHDAVQRVVKVRRDYNSWVARETMEDYALRFTPHGFRKWSEMRVANTAFGASSFLVLEALGATLLLSYGFTNAFWAILATGLIIFLAGWPISVYAARYGVDMDLLTRGAGFGYLGSTLTSLIYASFTFIFFALEAAIMAYALELVFGIPPAWGYLICAVVVLPLVTHGVTVISRFQVWTQLLWLVLMITPFVVVFAKQPHVLSELAAYTGVNGQGGPFNGLLFGAALTVGVALITQMGEQVDYLRFMPAQTEHNRKRWWAAVAIGGPGWVVPGVLKMLGGALLAYLALKQSIPADRAVDPNQMYLLAYGELFPRESWAIAATALLVVVSQLKINVTNAYAGSLAWSNFFARLTHSHPGRVVWMVFNLLIALMLMELNVFQALGKVLGLYSNIAISWIMAVVADLVINKPLGWSPKGIEFKRAHLYDINPVGVGAMGLASMLSVVAHLGWFGVEAQAFSAVIAMATALIVSPLIAWATKGRYYLARPTEVGCSDKPLPRVHTEHFDGTQTRPFQGAVFQMLRQAQAERAVSAQQKTADDDRGQYRLLRCTICERDYEGPDMAYCPAYLGHICSLCCSLDARCNDMCKPEANWSAQWQASARKLLPPRIWQQLNTELGRYLLLMSAILPTLATLFYLLWTHEFAQLDSTDTALKHALALGFTKAFAALAVVTGIVTWWLVLTHKSREVAQEESNRQTQALNEQTQALRREVESHQRTDEALQLAKQQAEEARHHADLANHAKSRYITTISHELRTPLNSIIGYAQLLDEDPSMPAHRQQAVRVIRRGGDHLLSLIEGTMDIARIESGKLSLDVKPMRFREGLLEIARMFELQAVGKGIAFVHDFGAAVPEVVRADEKRLRQILINVLGNAVKFTQMGRVVFRLSYGREMAVFEIEDTGPGITAQEMAQIFEPFARGSAAGSGGGSSPGGGTGLGLTIAKMLTDLMGGEMTVSSRPAGDSGQAHEAAYTGTVFRIRLFLPEVRAEMVAKAMPERQRIGYHGPRRKVLVVDNEEVDRELMRNMLTPLGLEVHVADSGVACLGLLRQVRFDAVWLDLAMPVMDGWQTITQMRALELSDAPVAVVSANAFEKGVDNAVGLPSTDFIVKPVRKNELLDWLGQAMRLQWIDVPTRPRNRSPEGFGHSVAPSVTTNVATELTEPHGPSAWVWPDSQQRQALEQVIAMGYLKGIMQQLDAIEHAAPTTASFVAHMRELARSFQLDAMSGVLRKADHEPESC
jgi:signal transduction histidine kinase/purine-cytosine permease-like protein/DNA-binding NarL/FixJ family response regulator